MMYLLIRRVLFGAAVPGEGGDRGRAEEGEPVFGAVSRAICVCSRTKGRIVWLGTDMIFDVKQTKSIALLQIVSMLFLFFFSFFFFWWRMMQVTVCPT